MLWGVCPVCRAAVLLPMALTLGRRCSPVHTTRVRRPPQSGVLVPDSQPITPRTSSDGPHMAASSTSCDHGTEDAMLVPQKRRGEGQLTRTDLSRKVYPRQPRAPTEPRRKRTASKQDSEPDAFDLTFQIGLVDMLPAPVTPSHTTSIPCPSSVLPISSIFS